MTKRKFEQVNPEGMKILRKALGLEKSPCSYCGDNIAENDKYSIFSQPTRIICNSVLCLLEAVEDG